MKEHTRQKGIKCILALATAFAMAGCTAAPASTSPAPASPAPASNQPTPTPLVSLEDIEVYAPAFSEAETDVSWDKGSATIITLEGDAAKVEGEGAIAVDGGVKISEAGTYVLEGTLEDGQVVASVESGETLRLVLNGVNITSNTSAPLYLANGDTILILAEGTQNVLTDAASYQYADSTAIEPNACLFADDNLTIIGQGALSVNGNCNNGICSKDELKIDAGEITVQAPNNGLKGNDCVMIQGGVIHIDGADDGIKAHNEKIPFKGIVYILGGEIHIVCSDDALQATGKVVILSGSQVMVKAGGKRINCDGSVYIADGALH